MITSSHIQIINLKVNVLAASLVREQVPDLDLVVRMRAIVRARAHFPPVRRRPHISTYCCAESSDRTC